MSACNHRKVDDEWGVGVPDGRKVSEGDIVTVERKDGTTSRWRLVQYARHDRRLGQHLWLAEPAKKGDKSTTTVRPVAVGDYDCVSGGNCGAAFGVGCGGAGCDVSP